MLIIMDLIQSTQSRDDQEIWTSFDTLSWSNGFSKRNELIAEVFDIKKIFKHQCNAIQGDIDLFKYKENLFLKLKEINISKCGLTKIPNVTFQLKYLTVLNLSNNFLEVLPKEFGCLCNLRKLILSGNKLNCLPKSIIHIQQLNYLDLSFNKFFIVPNVLYYGLKFLKILDLSYNEITEFNDPLACLNKLFVLRLSSNFLEKLPAWIFDSLCQLQFLDISQNKFSFSTELKKYYNSSIFQSLQSLNVYNCNVRHKDMQIISLFKSLRVLYLGNKKDVPGKIKGINFLGNIKMETFRNFEEIKELYLPNVQIASLPPELDCLKFLEILDLSDNFLSWLPECICDLLNLKVLYLMSNQILFLPINIGNLANLEQIHLSNNKLSDIPESFYNLTNLKFVDLYNNQIEKVKPSIFMNENLKGIDLELNCLKFSFSEIDVDKFKILYNRLKDSFRAHFFYSNIRHDLQVTEPDTSLNEINSETHSHSVVFSDSSFENELSSDSEDPFVKKSQENEEDEDWENKNSDQNEEDEYFDPNRLDIFQEPVYSSSLDFQNNYCPANYHVPSIMKTYIRNFKIASKNVIVEEGQFDSD